MDGWFDLFVANYGVNFLFKNNGDGSFTKITTGAIVTDNDNSFGASAADYNNDGLIDLFVANWNGKNCLYKNLTDFTFEKWSFREWQPITIIQKVVHGEIMIMTEIKIYLSLMME